MDQLPQDTYNNILNFLNVEFVWTILSQVNKNQYDLSRRHIEMIFIKKKKDSLFACSIIYRWIHSNDNDITMNMLKLGLPTVCNRKNAEERIGQFEANHSISVLDMLNQFYMWKNGQFFFDLSQPMVISKLFITLRKILCDGGILLKDDEQQQTLITDTLSQANNEFKKKQASCRVNIYEKAPHFKILINSSENIYNNKNEDMTITTAGRRPIKKKRLNLESKVVQNDSYYSKEELIAKMVKSCANYNFPIGPVNDEYWLPSKKRSAKRKKILYETNNNNNNNNNNIEVLPKIANIVTNGKFKNKIDVKKMAFELKKMGYDIEPPNHEINACVIRLKDNIGEQCQIIHCMIFTNGAYVMSGLKIIESIDRYFYMLKKLVKYYFLEAEFVKEGIKTKYF
jgi:hypothetical protein